MHKYHFFTLPELIKDKEASLPEDEAHHAVNVLRLGIGEEAILFDGTGFTYIAEAIQVEPLKFKIIEKKRFVLNKEIIVYVGLVKSRKLDLIIRQLTEIGCFKIIIFSSKRSVPLLSSEKVEKRLSRWRKIAIEASKQSKREYLPEIAFIKFEELIKNLEQPALTLYEEGGEPFKDCLMSIKNKVVLLIGPEGGFEKSEIAELRKAGSKICSIGKYILKVETAAVFAASVAYTMIDN